MLSRTGTAAVDEACQWDAAAVRTGPPPLQAVPTRKSGSEGNERFSRLGSRDCECMIPKEVVSRCGTCERSRSSLSVRVEIEHAPQRTNRPKEGQGGGGGPQRNAAAPNKLGIS